jgi:hypothetical protein
MQTLSNRSKPKFMPVNLEGVLKETETFRDKLREKMRRKEK